MSRSPYKNVLLAVCLLLLQSCVHQQERIPAEEEDAGGEVANAYGSTLPLFERDEIIDMTLKANFEPFLAKEKRENIRSEEVAPVNGTLTYVDKGKPVTLAVEVTPRGHNRFQKCPVLPQLKLYFPEVETKATPFAGIGNSEIKITTPCFESERFLSKGPRPKAATEYVLREYAIYRTIEKFGLPAFKTRLVRMTYLDLQNKEIIRGYTFFLEPAKVMARRYNARYVGWRKLLKKGLDEKIPLEKFELEIRLHKALYQEHLDHDFYNFRDDSVLNNHGFLFSNQTNDLVGIISYDFDWSELVRSPIKLKQWSNDDLNFNIQNLQSILEGEYRDADHKKTAQIFASIHLNQKRDVTEAIAKIPLKDPSLINTNLERIFAVLKKYAK